MKGANDVMIVMCRNVTKLRCNYDTEYCARNVLMKIQFARRMRMRQPGIM